MSSNSQFGTATARRTTRPGLRLDPLEIRDVSTGGLIVHAFRDANGKGAWNADEAGAPGVMISCIDVSNAMAYGVKTGAYGTAAADLMDESRTFGAAGQRKPSAAGLS